MLGLACVFLLCVDMLCNNWEVIDYVGNAKHLLTPLLTIPTTSKLIHQFAFPRHASPAQVSQIGQFMINTTLAHVQTRDSHTYILGTTKHLVKNSDNDICGQLVSSYPVRNPAAAAVQLGSVADFITFVRGDALTHWFGDTQTSPRATTGMNETQLRALGYIPARHGTDLRLTAAVALPPSGQPTAATVAMYRFFMRTFCTGSEPGTELGLDTCAIEYLYNDTTQTLDVTSSQAIVGNYHELGFIFQRRGGPVLALYVRLATLVLLIGVYSASQKTVQWIDFSTQSIPQRVLRLIAPPLHREPCSVFGLSDICFNSDVFVVLYTLAVLADEEISMVYSRNMNQWHVRGGTDVWLDVRLMSMTARWLWVNCFLLKAFKWTCNFVSIAQHTGDSQLMGWLNFSSVSWMYLSVVTLLERNDFIEYGSSVRTDLSSTTQNLDATSVFLLQSWYIRSIPSLAAVIFANLVLLLVVDHVVNRKWWQFMAANSLGRQLVFNSTSILANIPLDPAAQVRGAESVTMHARALCTFRWFLASHLTRFGLPEPPAAIRALTAAHNVNPATRVFASQKPKFLADVGNLDSVVAAPPPHVPTSNLSMVLQDSDGNIHLVNAFKQDIATTAIETMIQQNTHVTMM
ncbi:hypothetical protein DYB32_009870 [Aphanomyces invadans]|uniref:Polycystin domain-containing protein n=1 Tax=Aphanomyces invadans TaxID=157072 RepID=A0A418AJX4_9STRA|nr:hypothetical protein DYB32_009870 [Aphanomyces invadans]